MQERRYIWQTYEVTRETNDAVTIAFDTAGARFEYLPGQFVNVCLLIDGKKLIRSYSLSSSPGIDPHPAITVKRVGEGLMSNYINRYAGKIQEWEIEGPYGSFVPMESSYQSRHVVLLSGGSGITPLLSMAKSLLSRSPQVQLTLLYANRNWYDVIFADAIEALALQYKERLTVFHALSQHDGASLAFTGNLIEERLGKLLVKKLLKQAIPGNGSDTHFFMCGPNGLMNIYQEALASLEVPDTRIFMERFIIDDSPIALPDVPEVPCEVLVHFYEQTHLISISPGTTLLNAALKEGIAFRYSCKTGTCGSCFALLTSGKVSMVKNYALTAEEVARGMILLCQSYPLSEDVTIELD